MYVMARGDASRRAADEWEAEDDSGLDRNLVPLQSVTVSGNSGSLRVTLPCPTARNVGVAQGDRLAVFYDAENEEFVYRPPD